MGPREPTVRRVRARVGAPRPRQPPDGAAVRAASAAPVRRRRRRGGSGGGRGEEGDGAEPPPAQAERHGRGERRDADGQGGAALHHLRPEAVTDCGARTHQELSPPAPGVFARAATASQAATATGYGYGVRVALLGAGGAEQGDQAGRWDWIDLDGDGWTKCYRPSAS